MFFIIHEIYKVLMCLIEILFTQFIFTDIFDSTLEST